MDTHMRPSVVLVSRCFVVKESRILVIRRLRAGHDPLLWEVPGGKLDEGQDLRGALEREVMRETGLWVRPVDTITHFESRVLGRGGEYGGMPYVVLFSIAAVVDGELSVGIGHFDSKWCHHAALIKLPLTDETRRAATVLKERLT